MIFRISLERGDAAVVACPMLRLGNHGLGDVVRFRSPCPRSVGVSMACAT